MGILDKAVFITCAIGLCLVTRQATAWNAEGHMVVAQYAYNHLDPVVKTQCDYLISVPVLDSDNSNSNFVTAACWADDIKNFSGTSGFSSWHYIDIPFSLDGKSTNGYVTPSINAVWAINNCVAALRNPNTSVSNQAFYLRFLIHFVGDIQQPLHASDAVSTNNPNGDAGGNGFGITGYGGSLHSLWDRGADWLVDPVSRPLTATGVANISNRVLLAEQAYPFVRRIGMFEDPYSWAVEGWWLAQTNAYAGISPNTSPNPTYLNKVRPTTNQRMAMGGTRLANLLNTIYAPPPFPLTFSNVGADRVSVSWNSIVGRTYRVQWKQQMDGGWTTLTDLTATANSLSVTDSVETPNRFYRVIVLQ